MPSHKPQKATKCLNYLEIDLKQSKRCVNICTTRTTIEEDLPVNRLLFATIFRNEDNFGSDYAEDSLEENYITLLSAAWHASFNSKIEQQDTNFNFRSFHTVMSFKTKGDVHIIQ